MKRLLGVTLSLLVLAVGVAPAHAGSAKFIKTPDGNITCSLFKGGKHQKGFLRCDIAQHTWVAPAKPKSCRLDYGDGVSMNERGGPKFNCVGDSSIGVGTPLPVGQTATKGRFSCTVSIAADHVSDNVSCVNRRNHRGFNLSAASVSFFGS